jgi:hypothetical protein
LNIAGRARYRPAGIVRPEKCWDRTGYRFVKRQSQTDQNVWLQIGDPLVAPDYISR